MHVLFIMELMIWKPFSFHLCCIVCLFLGIWAIYYENMCLVLRRSACPFRQVKTEIRKKVHLPGQVCKYSCHNIKEDYHLF